MNLRQHFYQNPPLAYLPFSLSSSVLVLISSVRQEQVRYVAQPELRRSRLGEAALVTDVVPPMRTAPCSPGRGMVHILEAARVQHFTYKWFESELI